MSKTLTDTSTGCLNWTASKFHDGYGQFRHDASRPNVRAHREAWELFKGEIPHSSQVLHRCDNPGCVNVEHLFLGTHQDNVTDKVRKKRHKDPQGRVCANLSDEQIDQIRSLGPTTTQRQLSRQFGVSQSTIWEILHGGTRKTLKMNLEGSDFTGTRRDKLTPEKVGEIIQARAKGLTQEVLAAQFGVHQTTISQVLKKAGTQPESVSNGIAS